MSDEAKSEEREMVPVPPKTKTPVKTVVLATGVHHGGPFIVAHLGLPDLLPEGTEYTPEQADEVRTLAHLSRVPLIEKES